jgi:hypothetical protein
LRHIEDKQPRRACRDERTPILDRDASHEVGQRNARTRLGVPGLRTRSRVEYEQARSRTGVDPAINGRDRSDGAAHHRNTRRRGTKQSRLEKEHDQKRTLSWERRHTSFGSHGHK